MIYLASPYSHPDPVIRADRAAAALIYAAELMSIGSMVFSPIAYGHSMLAHRALPTDHVWWETFNKSMFGVCDSMAVLCLLGWEKSAGIDRELTWAAERLLPVHMINADWTTRNTI